MTDDERDRSADAPDPPDPDPRAERAALRHADALAGVPTPVAPGDEAVAVALDRTRADLAGLRDTSAPAGVLADLHRALAEERADGVHTPDRPASAPSRSPGPRRRLLLAVAAVAVVVVAGVAGVVGLGGSGGPGTPAPAPTAAPAPPPPPDALVLARGDGPAALRSGLGRRDYGTLADPARLASCLAAHGVPGTVTPIGARRVVLDGTPGVLLVLPTGAAARFRVLVVGEACSATAPSTLADSVVGP